jgi:uncharacterized membrane protein
MRAASWVAPVLFVAGGLSIAVAIGDGGAHAALVVAVPVLYGDSPLFLLGVLLLVAGIVSLPWAFDSVTRDRPGAVESGTGGVVVLGPIPVFWGNAVGASRRLRIALSVAGAVALVVTILALVAWIR